MTEHISGLAGTSDAEPQVGDSFEIYEDESQISTNIHSVILKPGQATSLLKILRKQDLIFVASSRMKNEEKTAAIDHLRNFLIENRDWTPETVQEIFYVDPLLAKIQIFARPELGFLHRASEKSPEQMYEVIQALSSELYFFNPSLKIQAVERFLNTQGPDYDLKKAEDILSIADILFTDVSVLIRFQLPAMQSYCNNAKTYISEHYEYSEYTKVNSEKPDSSAKKGWEGFVQTTLGEVLDVLQTRITQLSHFQNNEDPNSEWSRLLAAREKLRKIVPQSTQAVDSMTPPPMQQ